MRKWTNDDTIKLMSLIEGSNRNLKLIQMDIMFDGGKFIRIHGDRKYGMIIGAMSDEYDFYWIVEGSDLDLRITSCVGGYDIVCGEIPDELSVLNWMVENDNEGLRDRIMSQLEPVLKGEDCMLITDLYFEDNRTPFIFKK